MQININVNKKFVAVGVTVILTLIVLISATVTIPNAFTSGDTISASKMNENFNALKNVFNTTTGYLPYDDGSKLSNSGVYWDNTNGRLGVGTTSPIAKLNVEGASGTIQAMFGAPSTVTNASVFFNNETINGGYYANSDDGCLYLNQLGYLGGTTKYRDLFISNGRGQPIAFFDGSTGNVGIGTTNPGYKLIVQGTDSGEFISEFTNKSSTGQGVLIQAGYGNDYWPLCINDYSSGTIFYIRGNGNGWMAGTLSQSSDFRLKEKVSNIESALDKINKINGVSYFWKDKSNPDKQIGVIAQDVEKVFPELVTIQKDGMRSVNYNGLIAPTIEAIKELKSQKDSEIAALKKENEELREEINLIKEKLGIK